MATPHTLTGAGPFDIRKGAFLYVWWRFDNKNDYELCKESQKYPRFKNFVVGDFLGVVSVAKKHKEFDMTLFREELTGDQVLGLGGAQVTKIALRKVLGLKYMKRKIGIAQKNVFTEEEILRLDAQKLQWHWDVWDPNDNGTSGDDGLIKGRVIDLDKYVAGAINPRDKAHRDRIKNMIIHNMQNTPADQPKIPEGLAQGFMDPTIAAGIDTADVWINNHNAVVPDDHSNNQGFFEFKKLPLNQDFTVFAKKAGYVSPSNPANDTQDHIFPGIPFKLDSGNKTQEFVIIPMIKGGGGPPPPPGANYVKGKVVDVDELSSKNNPLFQRLTNAIRAGTTPVIDEALAEDLLKEPGIGKETVEVILNAKDSSGTALPPQTTRTYGGLPSNPGKGRFMFNPVPKQHKLVLHAVPPPNYEEYLGTNCEHIYPLKPFNLNGIYQNEENVIILIKKKGPPPPTSNHVKGKVVDMLKVQALAGGILYTKIETELTKTPGKITQQLAEELMAKNGIGIIDGVDVTLNAKNASGTTLPPEHTHTKHSEGKFTFNNVPIDHKLKLNATPPSTHQEFMGTNCRHIHPDIDFFLTRTDPNEENVIILLQKKGTPKTGIVKGRVINITELGRLHPPHQKEIEDALRNDTPISKTLAEALVMPHYPSIGVETDVTLKDKWPIGGKNIKKGTSGSDGSFEFKNVDLHIDLYALASPTSTCQPYKGKQQLHVHPMKPFKLPMADGSNELVIIPMVEGKPAVPKLIILPSQHNAKNHKQLKKPFGTKDIVTKISEKAEGDQLCFRLTGDATKAYFKGYRLRVFFAKAKDPAGKIWRPLLPLGEINSCHDVQINYDGGKKQNGKIREAIELKENKPRTIVPLFTAPPNPGTYRIYCLLTKGRVNYIRLLNDDVHYAPDGNLVDYNYIEFEVADSDGIIIKKGKKKEVLSILDHMNELEQMLEKEKLETWRWMDEKEVISLKRLVKKLKKLEEEIIAPADNLEKAKLGRESMPKRIKHIQKILEKVLDTYKRHPKDLKDVATQLETGGMGVRDLENALITIIATMKKKCNAKD